MADESAIELLHDQLPPRKGGSQVTRLIRGLIIGEPSLPAAQRKLWENRAAQLKLSQMNDHLPKSNIPHSWGVAFRPTLLFMVAFALNVTPHEIAHAITGYWLGFNSTVFQMWVNPDSAEAAPWQLAIIALSGPVFSLTVGTVCYVIYKLHFRETPSGLGFLMMAIVGVYSFLGPLAGAAFGGDFHLAFAFLNIATTVGYLTSATGFLLLPSFMYYAGRELLRWVPREFDRTTAVLCATVAPWLLGSSLLLLVYWPLPRFLIGPMVVGSAFWVFAVLAASLGFPSRRPAETLSSFNRTDLLLAFATLTMVRLLANGIRLGH